MERRAIITAFACGAASVLALGVIIAQWAHADSVTPDLSGLTAAIAAAQQTAQTAQNQAATAQSSAATAQTQSTAAQTAATNAVSTANAATTAAASVPTDYLGTYTLATMPSAAANPGKRALVTDLGGGPGYLRATNGCWKRISTTTAQIQTVTVATGVTVDGLANSPIIGFTGSAFASKATITVTNACSMPQLTVVIPAGVFAVTGAMGIAIGTNNLSVAGIGTTGTWNDYAIAADGSALTKVRGGSL